MKKLLSLVCLTASLGVGSVQAHWEYGFLLGVSGGYTWNDMDVDTTIFNVATSVPYAALSDEFDNNRWGWGILGGFQAKCHRLLLGLELNVDWQDDHSDAGNFLTYSNVNGALVNSTSVTQENEAVVALTARVGYDISSWLMGYLRAGIETYETEFDYSGIDTTGAILVNGNAERRTWAFVGGAGIEMPVPVLTGITFRTEWNYHSKGRSVDATSLWTNNASLQAVSVRPDSANTVKASLVYNFPV